MGRLSDSEFNAIVNTVASGVGRVVKVSTRGLTGEVFIKSASGKLTWNSFFSLDTVTGQVKRSTPYPSSTAIRTFTENLSKAVREAMKD